MKMKCCRLMALLLAAVVLLGGCTVGADSAWVYSHAGDQMPAGLYITYQIMAVGDAQDILSQENAGLEGFTMPTTMSDLLKTTVQGKNTQQWVTEKTYEYVRLHFYIEQLFDEMGLEMTEQLQMVAEYYASSIWAESGSVLEKNGISQSSHSLRSVNDVKMQQIFDTLYGEGGEREPALEELRQSFAQTYAYLDIISDAKPSEIPEGSEKTLEELAADMKTLLEGYIPRLEAGESFEDIQYEFALAQARINGVDESEVTKPEPGELSLLLDKNETGTYRADFIEQVMGAEVGKVVLIDLTDAYLLLRKYDVLEQEGLFDSYRYTVLNALKYDEYMDGLISGSAGISLESNQKAVNRYALSNLKLS